MPISTITTDYSGRTVDINILQNVHPPKTTTVSPSFGTISSYCTGVQKLIQRYTIALLTELGSQTNYPTFGTNLIANLNNRNLVVGIPELTNIFNYANLKVVQEFRNYQRTATQPDDEKLDTAVLVKISSTGDTVMLSIMIYPVAQPSVAFILPVPLSN